MTTITSDTLLVRNPDLIATEMDGDTVMMSIERGEYYGLGGVGGFVWSLLAKPTRVSQLTQAVCAEFDVDEAKCEADLLHFADVLLQNDAIALC